MSDEIKKNIAKELVGVAVDTVFLALTIATGFVKPLVKGLVLGVIQDCFNDYKERTLSIAE